MAQAVPMYYTFEGTPNETITTSTYTFVFDLFVLNNLVHPSRYRMTPPEGWEELGVGIGHIIVNYGDVFIDGIKKEWSEVVKVTSPYAESVEEIVGYPDNEHLHMSFFKFGGFVAEDYQPLLLHEFELGDRFVIATDWGDTQLDPHNENQQWIFLTSVTQNYPIPEPCTFFLLGSGLMGLAAFRKKCKKS